MRIAERLGLVACALAVFALVEPRVSFLGPWCALVCLASLLRLASEGIRYRLLPALVGVFAGIIARTGYNQGADTVGYLANVVSLLQDFDLDQANQFIAWGLVPPEAGPAGMAVNAQPVGNAFIWAVPALIAHGYAILTGAWAANFTSPPYLGAMIATNLVIALSGALALARLLAREFGPTAAALAVAVSVLASPVLFYLTRQPLMAHSLAFGFSCWAIVLLARASDTDSASSWRWAGMVLGAATACRFQAVVLFGLVPLLGSWNGRALFRRLLHVVPPALLMLAPQIVVSLRTFGRFIAIPQGSGFLNWTSPHWVDTLVSADRGLFNWHPVLLLGLLGLLLPRAPLRRLASAGLVVVVLTIWVNGAAKDFNGSDAFGARRYDLAIPFFAIGLARLFGALTPVLVRRPLALPAFLLLVGVGWNVLLIADYGRLFRESAPADDVAAARMRRLREGAEATLGWLGSRMRFRIYDAFVGLYVYRNYRNGGDFDVATLEPRFMRSGWSEVRAWEDGTLFRYVLFPQACLIIPLEEPFDLHGSVLARAPARIRDQHMSLILNGQVLTETPLPAAWTEVPFVAPSRLWIAGENEFCFRLSRKRPGDESDDQAFSAAVVRVQLP